MELLLVSAVIGLIVGSAATAFIHRATVGKSWMAGRSHCPRCNHVLAPRDLVPLFSFILLRGRCRHCQGPIGWMYPAVEGVTALLFASSVLARSQGVPGDGLFDDPALQFLVLRDWFAISVLIVIFGIDLIAGIIPDAVTLPTIVILFGWNMALGTVSPASMAIGMAAAGGFFLFQYWISRGRWIGGGDIRLGALIGAAVGWPGALVALLVAYLVGAAASVGLVASGAKTWKSQIPFGTFLSVGAVTALLWGDALVFWYVHRLLAI